MYDQYDVIATEYARAFPDDFASRPFERAVIRAFADLVQQSGGDHVLDVGCGPGQATAQLGAAGHRVDAVDGSPAMVSLARQRHPDAGYRVADMFSLPYPDGTFAGVCSWYSIIHTPADRLAVLFAEFGRVLTEPGWLLLGFQTEAPPLVFDEAFGHKVDMTFLRHDIGAVHEALLATGFTVHVTSKRERLHHLNETAAQAFIIAHRGPIR
ncbi:class I SAM-dependent methyltransferase [Mycolicibacterium goodii]|uniref:class I SAM-dependent methyltransferase n=1 Tax=Mycolicibacterium goodii TaxID=134601 RepID=UPI00296EC3C9